ncbi:MAG: squalene--hopene cyclase [Dehalococcoidia bacterium]
MPILAPTVRTGAVYRVFGKSDTRSVDEAIERTHAFLRATQHKNGYWWGELESNPTMEAEYVFLMHILGVGNDERLRKVANFIEQRQQEDGGWGMYYGGAGDLSTTIECYTALKMAGRDPDSDSMKAARNLILGKGGIEGARIFTKIWLAMLGQWDWKGTPYLAPELVLLPTPLPLNIYSFASWTRATVVPMTVILSQHPTFPLSPEMAIDELYASGRQNAVYSLPAPVGRSWERILFAADRILRAADRLLWNPLRPRALKEVEKWICQHQEADGSWGGIQPPWVYSLIALTQLGYSPDHNVIRRGLEGFEGFAIESDDTWQLQACVSPVWDTCLTVNSLIESGMDPDDLMIVRASDWLINQQILKPGDWQVKVKNAEPGGWAFEFANEMYPDTDDAAEILLAIGRAGNSNPAGCDAAVKRGMRWLLSMQSRNGGWGSFDKDNTSRLVTKLPFFDFGETIDPPSVDVTAHIVEAIGRLGWTPGMPSVERALKYLWNEQEEDGPWFGRWGVNYIYGTGAVLPALEALGHDMSDPRVQLAADWIESCQNSDGGWGETCASYADPRLRGVGINTPSQTGWALMALIAAGRGGSDAARHGVEYLVSTQLPDGTWEEQQYTAAGFPGYGIGDRRFKSPEGDPGSLLPGELPSGFMIKYHMYRVYWPLLALGRYRATVTAATPGGSLPDRSQGVIGLADG